MAWILWAVASLVWLFAVLIGMFFLSGWGEQRLAFERRPGLASVLFALLWFGALSTVVALFVNFAPAEVPTATAVILEGTVAAYSIMMALIFRSRLIERRTQRFLRGMDMELDEERR